MSSTLDASLDDPETSYEDQARILLAAGTNERRRLGAALRERADGFKDAADRLYARADRLDPQPVPFEALRHGDHVWIEDEWHEVLEKMTRSNVDGQTRELVVTRLNGFRIRRTVEVFEGRLFERGAF